MRRVIRLRLFLLVGIGLTMFIGLAGLSLSLVLAQASNEFTRVTVASDSNRDSESPHLSADGTRLVFHSDADFLDQDISDNQFEIWLYDTRAMTYTRITTASSGDRDSFDPVMSGDGTKVAFRGNSDFLEQDVPPNRVEIWLKDLETGTYTRVTRASADGRVSFAPSLSGDGGRIAFVSDSDLLEEGMADNQFQIWLYDTETMAYTRVTTASARNRDSFDPVLSADGTTLAFDSDSDLLDQGVANNQSEIWLYDVDAEELSRITTASEPTRASYSPSLDADGTKIAFSSDSDFLDQGIAPGQVEIWLYDTGAMTYTRITTASHTNRASVAPRLSADGTTITFLSDSDFFIQRIRPGQFEVWQYDVGTGELTRVTIASATNRTSESVDLNADGTVLAFDSDSDFLNQGISRLQYEVWLYSQP